MDFLAIIKDLRNWMMVNHFEFELCCIESPTAMRLYNLRRLRPEGIFINTKRATHALSYIFSVILAAV